MKRFLSIVTILFSSSLFGASFQSPKKDSAVTLPEIFQELLAQQKKTNMFLEVNNQCLEKLVATLSIVNQNLQRVERAIHQQTETIAPEEPQAQALPLLMQMPAQPLCAQVPSMIMNGSAPASIFSYAQTGHNSEIVSTRYSAMPVQQVTYPEAPKLTNGNGYMLMTYQQSKQ